MIPRWHYLFRRYLGFLPWQFCMVCGRAYWAGFPGCWNWSTWRFDWMPSMSDYCSKACCDEELDWLAETSSATRNNDGICSQVLTAASNSSSTDWSIEDAIAAMKRMRDINPPSTLPVRIHAGPRAIFLMQVFLEKSSVPGAAQCLYGLPVEYDDRLPGGSYQIEYADKSRETFVLDMPETR